MKKLLTIAMVVVFALSVFVGCSAPAEPAAPETPAEPAAADGNIVKLGLGHLTSIAKSKDLGTDKDGKEVLPLGQVDTVMAAVGFDKDGKVVSITIDTAQTKVSFDNKLQLISDPKAEYKTKVELKEEYGMIKASKIGKEWYQQAEALEKWMVGKTVDEIKAMKTKDSNGKILTDEADLTSLVTVDVANYIAAVEEAYANAIDVTNGVKVGLGHNIDISKSKSLGTDKDGKEVLPLAQVDTVMAATAFDKDGKVVGTIIDSAQTKINFDKDGKVTSDKNAEYKTKVELKEEYGMIKASKIGKEWYQQADALGKWMVGKTVDEIKAMKTKDSNGKTLTDEADLTSLVTVDVANYIAAVAESYANAK